MNESFWDIYAAAYDKLNILNYYQEMLNFLARSISDSGIPPERLLDVACGTGALLQRLHEKLPQTKLVGVDRSQAMLKVARRKLLSSDVVLDRQDLKDGLSYADQSYDAVTCINALYALPDPEKVLAEMYRVLVPGGELFLVNLWKPKQSWIFADHFFFLVRYGRLGDMCETAMNLPIFAFISAVNAVIARRAKRQTLHIYSPHELRKRVEHAGFKISSVYDSVCAGTCCLVCAYRPHDPVF